MRGGTQQSGGEGAHAFHSPRKPGSREKTCVCPPPVAPAPRVHCVPDTRTEPRPPSSLPGPAARRGPALPLRPLRQPTPKAAVRAPTPKSFISEFSLFSPSHWGGGVGGSWVPRASLLLFPRVPLNLPQVV